MTKIYCAALLLTAVCCIASAQTPAAEPAPPPQGVEQESVAGTTQEGEPGEPSPAGRLSLFDGIAGNAATHLGFAFSSYEMFTTNAFRDPNGSGLTMTMFNPQIFTNLRGKHSQLHMDYSLGYRKYQQKGELDTFAHSATMSWDVRLARNTSFQLTDTFTSSPNDYGFTPDRLSLIQQIIQPIFAQAILVDRQRLVRNSLAASVSQRAGKRAKVSVFGSHDYLRYNKAAFNRTQGFQVGVQAAFQINKWLYLDNSYSTYVNAVDDAFRSSDIQRLQVGGFHFQLSKSTRIFASGTGEYTRYLGVGHTIAGFDGGVSRSTKSNSITLSYHRGLSTTLGPGTILDGHNATLAFSQRLSSRFTLQMDTSYVRGVGFDQDSKLESTSGNAGIQIGLLRNLIFSTSAGYVSQRVSNLPFEAPNLRRYTAYGGIQYFMPTLRGH